MAGVSYPLKPFSFKDLGGGLNTRDNPTGLAPNETDFILNYTFSKGGGLSSRLGMTLIGTFPGTGANQGLWPFLSESEGELLLGVQGGILYSMNMSNGATTSLLTGLSATDMFDGEALGDSYYITSPTDGIIRIYYSGVTLTALAVSGSPKAACITDDGLGRLYASGVATARDRVYFCAFGNGTDWTSNANAGYFDITGSELDDNDFINVLKRSGSNIYAGRNSGAFQISGGNPFSISVNPLPYNQGMIGQKAYVVLDNWGHFLTQRHGVWALKLLFSRDKIRQG